MVKAKLRVAIPWVVIVAFPVYFVLTWIHFDEIRKFGSEELGEVVSSDLITKSTEYRIRTSSGVRLFVSRKDFNLGDSVPVVVYQDSLLVGGKSKSTFSYVSESLGHGHSHPFYLAMVAFIVCLIDRIGDLSFKWK